MTNITFTCTAAGSPAPSLSFLRGSEVLNNTAGVGSMGQTLAERVVVGEEEVMADTEGLHQVTREIFLFYAEDGDSGSFICMASTNIPETGERSDMVTFSLTVLSEWFV